MPPDQTGYQRLTRVRNTFGVITSGRYSLWQGPDHALLVQSRHFRESYKRFYYADIQAIVVRRTSVRLVWNLVWGGIALAFLLPSAAVASVSGIGPGPVVCWGLAGFFGICVLMNSLPGSACRCYFQTAVQTEEIPSLNRWRKTRRVIARLKPVIEAAQGTLSPEAIANGIGAVGVPPPPLKPLRPEKGRVHEALFYLLLLDTGHTAFSIFRQGLVVQIFSGILLVGYVGLLIGAFVKQSNSNLPSAVKGMTWGALAFVGICLAWDVAYGICFTVWHPSVSFMQALPVHYTGYLVMRLTTGGASLLLGFMGLKRLYEFRRGLKSAGPPPGSTKSPAV